MYSSVIERGGGQKIKCNGIWVHGRFRNGKTEGEFATLHRRLEDEEMRYHRYFRASVHKFTVLLNPLSPELNPICYLLALLGAHHFLHVSRIRVKLSTFRRLMSYIYGAPILDVSRSHTTTQHSR